MTIKQIAEQDLSFEHEAFHYSDDWERLQNRCSECYNSIQNCRRTLRRYGLNTSEDNANTLDRNTLFRTLSDNR